MFCHPRNQSQDVFEAARSPSSELDVSGMSTAISNGCLLLSAACQNLCRHANSIPKRSSVFPRTAEDRISNSCNSSPLQPLPDNSCLWFKRQPAGLIRLQTVSKQDGKKPAFSSIASGSWSSDQLLHQPIELLVNIDRPSIRNAKLIHFFLPLLFFVK